jgi:uncharacterized membrane protein YidH (DUF202 family)
LVRSLLICGMLAGVCAGALATGFATVAGEGAIGNAISFEAEQAGAAGDAHGDPQVSRGIQKSVGLLAAAVVAGLALGGIFALVFAFAYGRVSRASPARTALGLAALAFVVIFLVPFIKYPANPPAVGDPDTIGYRTELYLLMIAISTLAAIGALRLRLAVSRRTSLVTATVIASSAYLLLVVVAGVAMPAVNEVPPRFPAKTLWEFRQASVGMNAVIWATIGLLFAATAPHVLAGRPIWPGRAAVTGRLVEAISRRSPRAARARQRD